MNNNSKYNSNSVRPVSDFHNENDAMFLDFFATMEVAFKLCLKHKSSSPNALRFRLDESYNLLKLCTDIWNMEYVPKPSIAFIIRYPCIREVIAADFSDRIVQHWLVAIIEPLMEDGVLDEHQYSCRIGKGNLAALRALRERIAIVSERYTLPAVVARWDLTSFFMSIDKRKLYDEIVALVVEKYHGPFKDIVLYLIRVLTFTLPAEHAVRHSPITEWGDLAPHKSAYNLEWFLALAIGNLLSQCYANFYNAPVFKWMRKCGLLPVNYVDDFSEVFRSMLEYKIAMPHISNQFMTDRGIKVHQRKSYVQYHGKGIKLLGGVVKYERLYVSNRTVAKFESKIYWYNTTCKGRFFRQLRQLQRFVAIVNSYMGLMIHFYSYNIRKREAEKIMEVWGKFLYFSDGYTKAVIKDKYNPRSCAVRKVRAQRRRDLRTIQKQYHEQERTTEWPAS